MSSTGVDRCSVLVLHQPSMVKLLMALPHWADTRPGLAGNSRVAAITRGVGTLANLVFVTACVRRRTDRPGPVPPDWTCRYGYLVAHGGTVMVGAIVILLLALWALGLITSYTLGGFIHILLLVVLAGLVFLMRQGRRF